MKKPLGIRISEKKGILIPLALVPAGALFLSVQSNQAEQPTQISRHEPVAEIQVVPSSVQSGDDSIYASKTVSSGNQGGSNLTPAVQKQVLESNSQPSIWVVDTYDDNKRLLSSFSLEIEHVSSQSIEGNYCYISNYGKKEDCFNKFSGTTLNSKTALSPTNMKYLITFNSSFKNLSGKATIDLDDTNIIWDLKEFPSGLGVGIPKHATLTKESQ